MLALRLSRSGGSVLRGGWQGMTWASWGSQQHPGLHPEDARATLREVIGVITVLQGKQTQAQRGESTSPRSHSRAGIPTQACLTPEPSQSDRGRAAPSQPLSPPCHWSAQAYGFLSPHPRGQTQGLGFPMASSGRRRTVLARIREPSPGRAAGQREATSALPQPQRPRPDHTR